jgi:hypothetical protein
MIFHLRKIRIYRPVPDGLLDFSIVKLSGGQSQQLAGLEMRLLSRDICGALVA